ncbi:NAD-dependent epimerase/dehydratase [Corchorus olitorius]|uniref:NAD-dependent epimerase/dehydratase n=1 Tax=Corchorus olitorius TaxID=93759 RepID=A0A1R3HBP0_9ROSI|nr:NAD-dependent epimerase/dehydratase [Corchorus olitorius]
MEREKGTVCVTGGTGFIGSWLIKRLLEEGYSVHTTVRADPEKHIDISFLTNLPGAAENLKIFSADLSNPESFDAAIEGCKGVFHVATPVDFGNNEPEEVVTKRTISGALGILKASLKSKLWRELFIPLAHPPSCSVVMKLRRWMRVFGVMWIFSLADVKGKKLPGLSSKKLLDAGFKFIYGVEDMLDGAIKCCKEKGYL